MKARTFILTAGATLALAVPAANATVAKSKHTSSKSQAATAFTYQQDAYNHQVPGQEVKFAVALNQKVLLS
ncbi:MAG: hypothetical protein ACXV3D_09685 [Halobacteriota archaeon]